MNSKAYSARKVNLVSLDPLLHGRDGRRAWVGVDVGKFEVCAVLHWGPGEFERPWAIANPTDLPAFVEILKRLSGANGGGARGLVVAMEPSGTYGDALRQACADAGLAVYRVSPKAAHDYAEVFDGVPSQHDGKDAAVIAELARLGKGAAWPWATPPESEQQIGYWVDRMDAHRRLLQIWCGRIEGRLARHWPEVLPQLKLTSPTLLNALVEYGGPAALAADPRAAAKLKRWGRTPLGSDAVARIVDGAKRSAGVRQHPADLQRLRDYAADALAAAARVKQAREQLLTWSRDVKPVAAMTPAVGNATACVLFTHLGDPAHYHCAAAYVKAMGLNLAERSSGTYKGRLKISKRGSGAARYWMYLAALRLAKATSPVRPWYLRKKDKDSGEAGRALVGVMRRLGLALYHVAAHGEAFDAERLFPGKRKADSKHGGRAPAGARREPQPQPGARTTARKGG